MNLALLQQLREHQIGIYLQGDKLKTKSRKNAMTKSLAGQIRGGKDALVQLLEQIQPVGMSTDKVEAELTFYKTALHQIQPLHELPIDHARGAQNAGISAQHHESISPAVWQALSALANSLDTDVANVLNSLFASWCLRWSHQDEVVFATTVNSCYQQPSGFDCAEQAAWFTPLLPLRMSMDADTQFDQFAQQIAQQRSQLSNNSVLSFEVLRGLISKDENESYAPLAQLALSVSEAPITALAQQRYQQFCKLGFDLALHIQPVEGAGNEGAGYESADNESAEASWSYNPALFNASSVERFAQSFNAMLQGACEAPQMPLSDLPLLSKQQQLAVMQVHQAQATSPVEQTLHQVFEQQVERYPEHIAVEFDGESVSYSELNQRANRLAHSLLEQGVAADELIGLCVERSLNSIIGILAILKAGGAYLPLDPDYPAERLSYLLSDSKVKIVLTDEHTFDEVYLKDVKTRRLDLVVSDSALNSANPNIAVKPEHLAYVIYTSGSTGNPKGVMIEHRHVLRLMNACEAHYDFNAEQVWSVFHSFSFDFSVWEIWGALLYGAKTVVVPRHVARYPQSFYELVAASKVTVLSQTPSAFEQFVAIDAKLQAELSLQYVVFGGEALNLQSLSSWTERRGDFLPALINMYGITETTVHVTFRQIHQADIDAGRGSLIGQPLADLSGWVFDARQQPVPFGAVGELYVGGAGVARGYLNRPELTAERFIEHSLSPDGLLYRTGDLVRRFEDGEMAYLGRIDHQVKLRGFRIELGEIETKLTQSNLVERGFVLLRGETGEDKRLVAYYTSPNSTATSEIEQANTLRAELTRELPDYMVPTAFVRIDAFPMTVNGKIDKAQLPEPKVGQDSKNYVAPQTDAEKLLSALWAENFSVARVGVHDDFFGLGGDSMKAIPLVAKMKAAGHSVGIKDLYQAPNIKALLALTSSQSKIELPDIPAFSLLTSAQKTWLDSEYQNGELVDAYPMTELQQGMIVQNQLSAELGTYHDILGYHIGTRFDEALFTKAVESATRSNEMLRTVFSVNSDHALQLVLQAHQPVIRVKDITHLDDAEQELYIKNWMDEDKVTLFDLDKPTWSVCIHLRGKDSFQYHLNFHHALLDGWSVAAFSHQVFIAFMDMKEGKAVTVASPALAYKYNVWHELQAVNDKAITTYWTDKLSDAQMPWWTGRERQKPERKTHTISGEQASAITKIARQLKVTEKNVVLASYLMLLSMLNGKKDVTTSVVVNSRPEFDGSDMTLGLFLNSLPLRLNLHTLTWHELITGAHAQGQDIQNVKHYPLPLVAREVGQDFSASLFNFVELHAYKGVEERVPVISGSAFDQNDYLFGCEVFKRTEAAGAVFEVHFIVESTIFPEEFFERIVQYYARIVDSLALDSPGILQNSHFMCDGEKQTLLHDWNDTQVDYGHTLLMHHLIEQQVAKTPNAVAAIIHGQTISYGELNDKANRLANYLISQGVKPESTVGLCLLRSLDMVVAILAVLKSGGAYVPLEPSMPSDRLNYMMEDAAISHVLCQNTSVSALPQSSVTQLNLDDADFTQLLVTQVASNPQVPALKPDNLAYIFYTSGSTGNPKGVMCRHKGLVNRMCWGQRKYQFTASDVFLQKTPFMFDISICEFMAPLMCGARIALPEPEGHKDPQHLLDVMKRENVTIAHFVPSMLATFLASVDISECKSLRWVINGGEEMSKELNNKFFATGTDSEYHNLYGPTEAAIETSYWHCDANSDYPFVPIGKPIDNTQLYVLNSEMELLPTGVEGELHIGGAGLARGYLNLEDTTKKTFVPHPFSANPDDRLYKTGDLARFLPDGNVQYLGRLDDQIKINGLRIELGEIKSRLLQLETVKEAVVMALRESGATDKLMAYIVPTKAVDEAHHSDFIVDLKTDLREHLPLYMIPAIMTVMAEFPLLPNGKVNKRALPAPDMQAGQDYVAPQTDAEQVLCGIWAESFGLERVGVDDDFFGLGGDSMQGIPLVSKMRSAGYAFGIKDLYVAPNIKALLVLAQTLGEGKSAAELPDIPAFSLLNAEDAAWVENYNESDILTDAYPMTELQQGMIAQNLLNPELGTYHDLQGYHLGTSFDEACFTTAVQRATDGNEMLRSLFSVSRDHSLLLVLKEYQPVINIKDISHLDDAEQELYIQNWLDGEKVTMFDVDKPGWNVWIHLRGENAFQYHLNFHHAMLDGWSVAGLNYQIFDAFIDAKEGKTAALVAGSGLDLGLGLSSGTAPLSYKYNVWHEQQAINDDSIADYWANELSDASMPWWAGRTPQAFSRQSYTIAGEQAASISKIARALKVTEKNVLLSTHLLLLSMLNGKKDVTTSVVVNTRPEFDGGDATLGLFLNSPPLRVNLQALNWNELITQTHAKSQHIQKVKHYPLPLVARQVGQDFSASLFNFIEIQAFSGLDQRIPVISASVFDQNDYLFFCDVYKYDEASDEHSAAKPVFEVRFNVESTIFPAEFVERILHYYERIIDSLVCRESGLLQNGDFISDGEKHTQLHTWNDTHVDYGHDLLMHKLIEAQVAKVPFAVAAVFEEQTITYGELNDKANRLANYLIGQGIKPDAAVGICLQRSLDMVVAILAVLKSGGAYVPLEPSMPADRIEYMLDDASIDYVLCHDASLSALPVHRSTRINMDNIANTILMAGQLATNPQVANLDPDSLAYIFYTSGSTGNPKGVMCRHEGVVNRMCWGQRKFQFSAGDVFLQKTPFMFDVSICEFMAPLMCGARIVMAKPEGHKDPQYLMDVIKRESVTIVHFVPSMLAIFLASQDITQCQSLRWVISSGEAISKELNNDFFASGTQCEYYNLYGPTEAAIEVSYWQCDPDSEYPFVPMGKPVDNTQLYILNSEMELLPTGVEGELHIGGAGLARGYVNLEDTTSKAFVPNPFSDNPNARLYKTGDLTRFLPDGNIQYLGRLDEQVKINGLRIELGEINSSLLQLEAVAEAVVMAHREGGDRLIAYVVPSEAVDEADRSDYVAQLKTDLRENLPLYMIPVIITVMDQFELLPSGKVNKRALPAPDMQAQQQYLAPETDTEQYLAQAWQRLLNLSEPVSASAGFFELGGQSLIAIRLISEINEQYDVLVPFAELFEHQCLNQLAALIDAQAMRHNMTFDQDDDLADNETELLF